MIFSKHFFRSKLTLSYPRFWGHLTYFCTRPLYIHLHSCISICKSMSFQSFSLGANLLSNSFINEKKAITFMSFQVSPHSIAYVLLALNRPSILGSSLFHESTAMLRSIFYNLMLCTDKLDYSTPTRDARISHRCENPLGACAYL